VVSGYYRDIIQLLTEAACQFVRHGKGSHEVWYSPITKKHFTVPKAKTRAMANGVLKDAGLPKSF
jgi:predicted RNA binding protein YcfA (HicA-like mRNA interferase family)